MMASFYHLFWVMERLLNNISNNIFLMLLWMDLINHLQVVKILKFSSYSISIVPQFMNNSKIPRMVQIIKGTECLVNLNLRYKGLGKKIRSSVIRKSFVKGTSRMWCLRTTLSTGNLKIWRMYSLDLPFRGTV